MVGIELRVKVTPILQKLQALGVLALPAGSTVLRLLPPLVIEERTWIGWWTRSGRRWNAEAGSWD